MGPTWGPPGSCRPQMGPMLAPWTSISGPSIRTIVEASQHQNAGVGLIYVMCLLLRFKPRFLRPGRVSLLALGRCRSNSKSIISNTNYGLMSWTFLMLLLSGECHRTRFMITKSLLVQVMAWCLHETSHYLSQCWHKSMLLYGVTRQRWVNMWFRPSMS